VLCVCMHTLYNWLLLLLAGLFLERPGSFSPGLVHVGFVVDEMVLGWAFIFHYHFTTAPYLWFIHVPLDILEA